MNHLGIYTGILYISHMNHIGMLYRNHMCQDTQMWKLLTCGEDINVATIQLLCNYHTTPMWLPYRNYWCTKWELYGSHTWELYGSHTESAIHTRSCNEKPHRILVANHTAPMCSHTELHTGSHTSCMVVA